jgi:uncharacterized protein (UPF0335 family)
MAKDVREVIVAPVREHSRKPHEAYARVERYCDGPYLELFARQHRQGWTAWGNEVGKLPLHRASRSDADRCRRHPFRSQPQGAPMTKKTNGFQPDVVAAFVDRIEALEAELKEHTEGVRVDIAAIFEEASDHEGIPKKALKMVLRERALMRKVRELPDDRARPIGSSAPRWATSTGRSSAKPPRSGRSPRREVSAVRSA